MATTEEILQRYPQLAGFIDHPELGPILQEAATNGWGTQELQGAIYKTQWYSRNWADKRKLEVLRSTDPAEYGKQREQAAYEVRSLMGQLGLDISDTGLIGEVTDHYLNHGKDDWFLYDYLGKKLKANPKLIINQQGQLGAKMTDYRQLSQDYLLPFGDDRLMTYAINEWRQLDTREGVEQRMRLQAIRTWAHLEDELKRGLTVRQILQPVTNTVAQTLEMNPDEIDLMDSRWRQLLEFKDDAGKTRTMTTAEAERYARHQREFESTKTAREEVYSMSRQLLESMGQI